MDVKNQKLQALEIAHQTELLDHTILATEEERKRLAGDLHDDVGTRLSALRVHIGDAAQLTNEKGDELKHEIDQVIQVVRDISHDIMPASIELFGLQVAVEQLTRSFNNSEQIQFSTKFVDMQELPSETSLAIYRIVQELMHNSIKHSKADIASLEFKQAMTRLHLKYHDNGIGMKSKSAHGLGLRSIKNRARMINAEIQWDRNRLKGVAMELIMPLT